MTPPLWRSSWRMASIARPGKRILAAALSKQSHAIRSRLAPRLHKADKARCVL
jgi:hypothetical protein